MKDNHLQTKETLPVVIKLGLAVLASAILFCALLLVAWIGFEIVYADRIYPGVYILDMEISGLTEDEASQVLSQSLNYTYEGQIQFTDQGQEWDASPIDLGYLVNPAASAHAAFMYGRSRWLVPNLADKARAWFQGVRLSPVMFYDERIAQHYLNDIAANLDTPMLEASLELNNTEVVVRNGQVGRKLDVDASLVALSGLLTSMQSGSVPLVVEETPPEILDASAQADLAREILSEPLILTAPPGGDVSGPWTIAPADLAGMLTISRVSNGHGEGPLYQVAVHEDLFAVYLNSLAADLHIDPVNTRFMFNDDTGLLEVIKPAVVGRNLNVQASVTTINDRLAAGEHQIALQFDTLQPQVTDEMTGTELGITELVEEQWTYFWGSDPARIQNITTAAAQFHGLLVAPGETFSMSDALGNISFENGYAEALIILGDQTIQGVGGGVCQVSTTLFRTVFFAGYPIVERHAHAYRVGYYEQEAGGARNSRWAGLDATVYVPIVDFKFTNDTDNWLLMETYVYPGSFSLLWKFYSIKDGRTVEWDTTGLTNVVPAPEDLYRENPELETGVIKKVDYAADGADVTIYRTVYNDGKVYFADSFYTHFLPWQAVYEYGPGTEGIPESNSN